MICLAVRILAQPGKESQVAETFRKLSAASRREPGCILYVAHQHNDDSRRFLVYEQYKDDAALVAHRDSPHFRELATEGVYTMIESREADLYQALS